VDPGILVCSSLGEKAGVNDYTILARKFSVESRAKPRQDIWEMKFPRSWCANYRDTRETCCVHYAFVQCKKSPTCIEDGETIMVCLEKKHTVNTGYLFGNNIADCHAYDPQQTHAFKNKQTKYTEQDKSRNGKLGKPKFM